MLTLYDIDTNNLTMEKLEAIWDYLEPKAQEMLEIKLSMQAINPIKKHPSQKWKRVQTNNKLIITQGA